MTDGTLVLVADDDEDILALVKLSLERLGHEVIAARDGHQALVLAEERPPGLAVLDISMPEVDGLEVLRRLRANGATKDLPVVLLSARAQEADVELGFAAGASAYMRKPFSPRELRDCVAGLLEA